ncbi:MAG TPA: DUF4956 domain-containing protein [Actinomycetales bacterium]|nr:DUF4956 domain-containing protein [Actinomycetales bacterium]
MLNLTVALLANTVAILILVFGMYFRRHHRRDLALSYLALNFGVLAVTALLSQSEVGMGLGLGLFGILSIIRLRSDAITQAEIAYYFIALALGLVNGLHPGAVWVAPAASVALIVVMWAGDSPLFARTTKRTTITLDRAYPREADLHAALAHLLDADILQTVVERIDTVRDTTVVDVRFRANRRQANQYGGYGAYGYHSMPAPQNGAADIFAQFAGDNR